MPEVYRVTIRLTPEVYAQLETQGRAGNPLAAIVRDALVDYLARQPQQPQRPLMVDDALPLAAAMAAMTARLDMLEAQIQELTAQRAVLTATTATRQPEPPPAATAARAAPGQRKLTPRQVRALRDKHLRGVPVPALMEEYQISRASVFRYLQSEQR